MLSEIERRAWDSRGKAEQHKPELALKVALDDIANGMVARHVVIVIVERSNETEDFVRMYQGGELSELAVEGALGRAIRLQTSDRDNEI